MNGISGSSVSPAGNQKEMCFVKKIAMSVDLRNEGGKGFSKKLRAEGKIPAVMYGGDKPVMLTVDKVDFQKNFKQISENILIDLDIKGGESKEVLIKDYQVDGVSGRLTHIDFYEIVRGKKIHTRIPIELTGTSIGVRLNGGLLEHLAHEVQVECLPKDIPEVIQIDVTDVDINQALHVSDIKFPEGVISIDPSETVVVTVAGAKGEAEAEEGEEEVVEEAE